MEAYSKVLREMATFLKKSWLTCWHQTQREPRSSSSLNGQNTPPKMKRLIPVNNGWITEWKQVSLLQSNQEQEKQGFFLQTWAGLSAVPRRRFRKMNACYSHDIICKNSQCGFQKFFKHEKSVSSCLLQWQWQATCVKSHDWLKSMKHKWTWQMKNQLEML